MCCSQSCIVAPQWLTVHGMHVQASAEDLQQQEASLAFIRSLSQQSGFVSSTTEWRRRQVGARPNPVCRRLPTLSNICAHLGGLYSSYDGHAVPWDAQLAYTHWRKHAGRH